MTLEIFVSQVSDLLKAMDVISYFLYIMIILIVLISISMTYKIIIHERTSEIGTMMAIGMQRKDVISILLFESAFVFILSLILGSIFSLLVLRVIYFISFDWIPGFEIFMQKGRLVPYFSIKTIFTNIIILMIITLPAAWVPSYRASRLNLTKALSGNK